MHTSGKIAIDRHLCPGAVSNGPRHQKLDVRRRVVEPPPEGEFGSLVLRRLTKCTALTRKRTSPDLLILDEFHRYADLIIPSPALGSTNGSALIRSF